MMVINAVKIVNQLEHQRRTWETEAHRSGSHLDGQSPKVKRLGRQIEALARTFALKPDGGGYWQ